MRWCYGSIAGDLEKKDNDPRPDGGYDEEKERNVGVIIHVKCLRNFLQIDN